MWNDEDEIGKRMDKKGWETGPFVLLIGNGAGNGAKAGHSRNLFE